MVGCSQEPRATAVGPELVTSLAVDCCLDTSSLRLALRAALLLTQHPEWCSQGQLALVLCWGPWLRSCPRFLLEPDRPGVET